jgi:hypothetical protein
MSLLVPKYVDLYGADQLRNKFFLYENTYNHIGHILDIYSLDTLQICFQWCSLQPPQQHGDLITEVMFNNNKYYKKNKVYALSIDFFNKHYIREEDYAQAIVELSMSQNLKKTLIECCLFNELMNMGVKINEK